MLRWADGVVIVVAVDVSLVFGPKPEEFSYEDNRTTFLRDPSRLGAGGFNGSSAFQQGVDGVKCCECAGPKDKLEEKEKIQLFKMEFENSLHNMIYVKNTYVSKYQW